MSAMHDNQIISQKDILERQMPNVVYLVQHVRWLVDVHRSDEPFLQQDQSYDLAYDSRPWIRNSYLLLQSGVH